jgi:hypothetical protein
MRRPKIVKEKPFDSDAKQIRYLEMCAKLTITERIEMLERLNKKA